MSANQPPPSAEELRKTQLFEVFDDASLSSVLASTKLVELPKRQTLFTVGESARYFYFVRSGQIKLFRASRDGDEKILSIIGADRLFAEAVMFMEWGAYPVSAQAIEESTLLAIHMDPVRAALRDSADLCFRALGNLSGRLHFLVDEIDRITLHSAASRLAFYLLQEASSDGESPEVVLRLPKLTLASRLSLRPETMSRLLGELTRRGLIEVDGARIKLLDREGLQSLGSM